MNNSDLKAIFNNCKSIREVITSIIYKIDAMKIEMPKRSKTHTEPARITLRTNHTRPSKIHRPGITTGNTNYNVCAVTKAHLGVRNTIVSPHRQALEIGDCKYINYTKCSYTAATFIKSNIDTINPWVFAGKATERAMEIYTPHKKRKIK